MYKIVYVENGNSIVVVPNVKDKATAQQRARSMSNAIPPSLKKYNKAAYKAVAV
jgi:hypothetical protein